MTEGRDIVPYRGAEITASGSGHLPSTLPPAIIVTAGGAAKYAWDEFFEASLANPYTRKNYIYAVSKFLRWAEKHGLHLLDIGPGDVGTYVRELKSEPPRNRKRAVLFEEKPLSTPTKKLHVAALRGFFDCLVRRHAIAINPAAAARTERYSVVEGKTPQIPAAQAKLLLASIPVSVKAPQLEGSKELESGTDVPDIVGMRDKAILAVLVYTAARVGAVSRLTAKSLVHDGTQYSLRFLEKGGKSREIPVRHDLEQMLLAYIQAAGITDGPLFLSSQGRSGNLSKNGMSPIDVCRMVKRRLKNAGLSTRYSPHSFRVTTITDLLEQDVRLEDVQTLAGHADARTTRLYDRRGKKVTRNIVERISI